LTCLPYIWDLMDDATLNRLMRTITTCARKVYEALGCGFATEVYLEALCLELLHAGLTDFDCRFSLPVHYQGETIGEHVFELAFSRRLVVAIRVADRLTGGELSRLSNLLEHFNLKGGLVLNFGGGRF